MIISFILLIILLLISLIELFLQTIWIKEYFTFGIKIYERVFSTRNENLGELFGRLKEDNKNSENIMIQFHMTKDYKIILFRRYIGIVFFRLRTILHGRIFEEGGSFRIIGYLPLYELFIYSYLLCLVIGLMVDSNINQIPINIIIAFVFILILFISDSINIIMTKALLVNI